MASELFPVKGIEYGYNKFRTAAINKLSGMTKEIASEIAKMKTPAQIEQFLDAKYRQALQELSELDFSETGET